MPQPLISLIMTTYKQEAFVGAAVRSVLAQEHDNLEIHISDDCSPDGTFDIIRREVSAYQGPHRIHLHRNPVNIGPTRNTAEVMKRVKGDFVVRCHGDDISMPDRVEVLVNLWKKSGATLVSSNCMLMDAQGRVQGRFIGNPLGDKITLEHLMEVGWDKRMLGATYGWETRLFRTFGGINPATLPSGGDRLLVFRACLLGGVVHEHRPLIKWRQHQDQQTKHICDRLNGPLIEAETLQAHATTCVLAMLKDVLDLKKKRVEGLGPIHNQLVGRLVQDTNQWIMLRNHLHNEGKRPTWADRSEMESRPVADTFQPEAV